MCVCVCVCVGGGGVTLFYLWFPGAGVHVVIVGCPAFVVYHQQLLQTKSPPKLLAGLYSNLIGMSLIWHILRTVQMVLVY